MREIRFIFIRMNKGINKGTWSSSWRQGLGRSIESNAQFGLSRVLQRKFLRRWQFRGTWNGDRQRMANMRGRSRERYLSGNVHLHRENFQPPL